MNHKEINKEAWKKANQFFRECLDNKDPSQVEYNLDLLRNTALFVLGIDAKHLATFNKWGPKEFIAHMDTLMTRVKDIYLAQVKMSQLKETELAPTTSKSGSTQ